MIRNFSREMIEKKIQESEEALKQYKAMLSTWDKLNNELENDTFEPNTTEEQVKAVYFFEQSMPEVGEWAFKNIEGFAGSKTEGLWKVRDIITDTTGEDDLSIAVRAIFSMNRYYANKYGYGR